MYGAITTTRMLTVGLLAAAVLLVTPLINQSFPFRTYTLWVSLPVLVAVFSLWFLQGNVRVRQNLVLTVLLSLVVVTYGVGVLRTEAGVPRSVLIDLAYGLVFTFACVAVLQLANRSDTPKVFLDFFKIVVIVYGLVIALLGGIKQSLLASGADLVDLATSNPDTDKLYVPATTSLVTDYNFFSLSLLIAGIFSLEKMVWARSQWRFVLYAAIAAFVLTVGFYSGSRRFWLTCIAVLLFLFTYQLARRVRPRTWAIGALGALAGTGFYFAIQSIDVRGLTEINWNDRTVHSSDPRDQIGLSSRDVEVQQNNYAALRQSLLQTDAKEHGLNARIIRWDYALDYYSERNSGLLDLLFGFGFSYFEDFGCRFSHCKIEDNPHSPVLSALLYGGAMGAIAISALVVYAALGSLYLLVTSTGSFGIPFSMISTILFVSISGNSIYSMPIFLVMIALLQLAIIAARRSDSDGPFLFR